MEKNEKLIRFAQNLQDLEAQFLKENEEKINWLLDEYLKKDTAFAGHCAEELVYLDMETCEFIIVTSEMMYHYWSLYGENDYAKWLNEGMEWLYLSEL